MRRRRTIITDQTRRVQATNRAVFAAVIVVAVLGLTVYTWPVSTQFVPDETMRWILTGLALLGVAVVALMIGLRPDRLICADPPDMTKVERKFMRRLRRRWAEDTRVAGLTRDEPLDDGSIYVDAPRVLSIERVPLGLRLLVRVVPGTDSDSYVNGVGGLASAVGAEQMRAKPVDKTRVEYTVELRDPMQGVRRAELGASPRVVVGRLDDGQNAVIDIRDPSHIIIQGQTGSGKSAFCYSLFSQLAQCKNVRLNGIDPNRVLLSPLVRAGKNPDGIVLGADPAEALALLNQVVARMDERLRLIDEEHHTDNITPGEFTEQLPVEVVILEEYGALIKRASQSDDRKVIKHIQSQVSRLCSEGRKVGIRVVLIIQRADAEVVGGSDRSQFGTAITMHVDKPEAVRMLHARATDEDMARVLTFPPGRCLFDQGKQLKYMQGDFCDYQDYQDRLGLRVHLTKEDEHAQSHLAY